MTPGGGHDGQGQSSGSSGFLGAIGKLCRDCGQGSRLSWDEYFGGMALLASARSPCERLRVGCVLVRDRRVLVRDRRVLAMGYNGFFRGAPHTSIMAHGHEQATVEAPRGTRLGSRVRDAKTHATRPPRASRDPPRSRSTRSRTPSATRRGRVFRLMVPTPTSRTTRPWPRRSLDARRARPRSLRAGTHLPRRSRRTWPRGSRRSAPAWPGSSTGFLLSVRVVEEKPRGRSYDQVCELRTVL